MFLVQVALGVILFATFQQWVPGETGAGDAWGGYLLGAYGGARFTFETATGALSDRIERRLGLLVGFTLMLPTIALMAIARNEHVFLLLAAQLGFGTAFLWPATYAIAADIYQSDRRGKVVSFLSLAQLLGFGGGALAGAFMVESGDFPQFATAFVAVALAFAAAVWGLPNYRGNHLFGRVLAPNRPPIRSVLSLRLAALSAIILGSTVAPAMAFPAIRPYGEYQLEVSFARLAVAMVPAIVAGALFYLPAGDLADRYGRSRPLFGGQALMVAGFLLLAATTELWVAVFAAMVIFAGNVLTVPAWNAAVMDLAPESHRGTLIGLSVALSGLGLAIGPTLGGFTVGHWDAPAAFQAAAAVAGITGLGVVLYARGYSPPQPRD